MNKKLRTGVKQTLFRIVKNSYVAFSYWLILEDKRSPNLPSVPFCMFFGDRLVIPPPPPNPSTKSLLPESTWEHILFSEKSQPFPSRSTRSSSGIETGTKLYVSNLISLVSWTMTSRFGRQRSKLCEGIFLTLWLLVLIVWFVISDSFTFGFDGMKLSLCLLSQLRWLIFSSCLRYVFSLHFILLDL